jgi:hypothetical protein
MVIAQKPNIWLILFAVGWIGLHLHAGGWRHAVFLFLYIGAGAVWALLEIISGDSWFRRVLGVVVAYVVISTLLG